MSNDIRQQLLLEVKGDVTDVMNAMRKLVSTGDESSKALTKQNELVRISLAAMAEDRKKMAVEYAAMLTSEREKLAAMVPEVKKLADAQKEAASQVSALQKTAATAREKAIGELSKQADAYGRIVKALGDEEEAVKKLDATYTKANLKRIEDIQRLLVEQQKAEHALRVNELKHVSTTIGANTSNNRLDRIKQQIAAEMVKAGVVLEVGITINDTEFKRKVEEDLNNLKGAARTTVEAMKVPYAELQAYTGQSTVNLKEAVDRIASELKSTDAGIVAEADKARNAYMALITEAEKLKNVTGPVFDVAKVPVGQTVTTGKNAEGESIKVDAMERYNAALQKAVSSYAALRANETQHEELEQKIVKLGEDRATEIKKAAEEDRTYVSQRTEGITRVDELQKRAGEAQNQLILKAGETEAQFQKRQEEAANLEKTNVAAVTAALEKQKQEYTAQEAVIKGIKAAEAEVNAEYEKQRQALQQISHMNTSQKAVSLVDVEKAKADVAKYKEIGHTAGTTFTAGLAAGIAGFFVGGPLGGIIAGGLVTAISAATGGFKNAFSSLFNVLPDTVKTALAPVQAAFGAVTGFISPIVNVVGGFASAIGSVISAVGSTVSSVGQMFGQAGQIAGQVLQTVIGWASEAGAKALEIRNLAVDIGSTVQAASNLNATLGLVGGGSDKVATAIDSVIKKAGEGDKAFTRMGVATRDSNGQLLDGTTILNNVALAYDAAANKTAFLSNVTSLFSPRMAATLIPLLSLGDGLAKLQQNAQDLGVSLDAGIIQKNLQVGLSMNLASQEVMNLKSAFIAGLQPAITRIVELITARLPDAMALIGKLAGTVTSFLMGLLSIFGPVSDEVKSVVGALTSVDKGTGAVGTTLEKTKEEAGKATDQFTLMSKALDLATKGNLSAVGDLNGEFKTLTGWDFSHFAGLSQSERDLKALGDDIKDLQLYYKGLKDTATEALRAEQNALKDLELEYKNAKQPIEDHIKDLERIKGAAQTAFDGEKHVLDQSKQAWVEWKNTVTDQLNAALAPLNAYKAALDDYIRNTNLNRKAEENPFTTDRSTHQDNVREITAARDNTEIPLKAAVRSAQELVTYLTEGEAKALEPWKTDLDQINAQINKIKADEEEALAPLNAAQSALKDRQGVAANALSDESEKLSDLQQKMQEEEQAARDAVVATAATGTAAAQALSDAAARLAQITADSASKIAEQQANAADQIAQINGDLQKRLQEQSTASAAKLAEITDQIAQVNADLQQKLADQSAASVAKQEEITGNLTAAQQRLADANKMLLTANAESVAAQEALVDADKDRLATLSDMTKAIDENRRATNENLKLQDLMGTSELGALEQQQKLLEQQTSGANNLRRSNETPQQYEARQKLATIKGQVDAIKATREIDAIRNKAEDDRRKQQIDAEKEVVNQRLKLNQDALSTLTNEYKTATAERKSAEKEIDSLLDQRAKEEASRIKAEATIRKTAAKQLDNLLDQRAKEEASRLTSETNERAKAAEQIAKIQKSLDQSVAKERHTLAEQTAKEQQTAARDLAKETSQATADTSKAQNAAAKAVRDHYASMLLSEKGRVDAAKDVVKQLLIQSRLLEQQKRDIEAAANKQLTPLQVKARGDTAQIDSITAAFLAPINAAHNQLKAAQNKLAADAAIWDGAIAIENQAIANDDLAIARIEARYRPLLEQAARYQDSNDTAIHDVQAAYAPLIAMADSALHSYEILLQGVVDHWQPIIDGLNGQIGSARDDLQAVVDTYDPLITAAQGRVTTLQETLTAIGEQETKALEPLQASYDKLSEQITQMKQDLADAKTALEAGKTGEATGGKPSGIIGANPADSAAGSKAGEAFRTAYEKALKEGPTSLGEEIGKTLKDAFKHPENIFGDVWTVFSKLALPELEKIGGWLKDRLGDAFTSLTEKRKPETLGRPDGGDGASSGLLTVAVQPSVVEEVAGKAAAIFSAAFEKVLGPLMEAVGRDVFDKLTFGMWKKSDGYTWPDLMNAITLGLWKSTDNVKWPGFVTRMFGGLSDAWKTASWNDLGTAIVDGIKAGFEKAADIGGWVKQKVSDLIGWFKEHLGIHSPSTVAADEVGAPLLLGILKGAEDKVGDLLDWVTKLPGRLLEKVGDATTWLQQTGKDIITGLSNGIVDIWKSVALFGAGVEGLVVGWFDKAETWLTQIGTDLFTGLKTGIDTVWTNITTFGGTVNGVVIGWFDKSATWLTQIGTDLFTGLKTSIDTVWTDITTFGQTIFGVVIGWFADNSNWLVKIGTDLFQGFLNGIGPTWASTLAWAGKIKDTVLGWFLDSLNWLYNIGYNIFWNFLNGILAIWTDTTSGITKFGTNIQSVVVGWFTGAIGWLTTAGTNIVTGLYNALTGTQGLSAKLEEVFGSLGTSMYNKFKDPAQTALNGIKNFVNGFIGGINSITGKIGITAIPEWGGYTLPPLPAAAAGAVNHPGGLTLVGERGPEIVNIPKGATIVPNHIAGKLTPFGMGGPGDLPIIGPILGGIKSLADGPINFAKDLLAKGVGAALGAALDATGISKLNLGSLFPTDAASTIMGHFKDNAVEFIKQLAEGVTKKFGKGDWQDPLPGHTIAQFFGMTDFALHGGPGGTPAYGGAPHTGYDVRASLGDSVAAASKGHVIATDDQGNAHYGKSVIIDHGNGVTSLYGHLSAQTAKIGEQINAGAEVGKAGTTGNSTGFHLHFEVRENGLPVDPGQYVQFPGGPKPTKGSVEGATEGATPGASFPNQAEIVGWIKAAMNRTGYGSDSWTPDLLWMIQHESGGNVHAHGKDPDDPVPSPASDPVGLFQVKEYNFPRGFSEADMMEPVNNSSAALTRIHSAWGTPRGIPGIGTGAYTGYGAGGLAGLLGQEIASLGEHGPELVIPADQTAALAKMGLITMRAGSFNDVAGPLVNSGSRSLAQTTSTIAGHASMQGGHSVTTNATFMPAQRTRAQELAYLEQMSNEALKKVLLEAHSRSR